MVTLQDLQDEYRRVGVDHQLLALLERIVWSTVRQYPAKEYSPSRVWDRAACEDVLNDWVSERLWGRADLQALLSSATTIAHLRSGLTTSLRQHLTNSRRRSVASNLYTRARTLMRSDPAFRAVGVDVAVEQHWALAVGGVSTPSASSLSDLVDAACELTDEELEVVRYGPFSLKLSPILREPKLRLFLLHLLTRARGSLALASIVDVMRLRFSLTTDELVELDSGLPSPTSGPADKATTSLHARSVVSRLDIEEAQLLTSHFRAGGSIDNTAEIAGVARERICQVLRRVFQMICDGSDSFDTARAVLRSVESLLLEGGD